MSLLADRGSAAAKVGIPVRAKRSRSSAERAAAEAFVYVMHRWQVGSYELAVEGWIGATDRPVAGGTNREIVRRYQCAPPFWALTVTADETVLAGYGVNAHAALVRYAQRTIPLGGDGDGFTAVRTEFGPGCRELLRQASGAVPVFICEPVSASEAEEVVKDYLIDAAMSLAEGRGPLLVSATA